MDRSVEGYNQVSLTTIANGAAVEHFNRELENVLSDMDDQNKDPKAARKIILEVTLNGSETREHANVAVKCTSKVPALKPVETAIFPAKEGRKNVAYERKETQPGFPFDGKVTDIESKQK